MEYSPNNLNCASPVNPTILGAMWQVTILPQTVIRQPHGDTRQCHTAMMITTGEAPQPQCYQWKKETLGLTKKRSTVTMKAGGVAFRVKTKFRSREVPTMPPVIVLQRSEVPATCLYGIICTLLMLWLMNYGWALCVTWEALNHPLATQFALCDARLLL